MKHKIYIGLFVFIFGVYLSNTFIVQAAVQKSTLNAVWIYYNGNSNYPYSIAFSSQNILYILDYGSTFKLSWDGTTAKSYAHTGNFETISDAYDYWNSVPDSNYISTASSNVTTFYTNYPNVAIKGSFNNSATNFYPTYDDYLDDISPKWYVVMWDTLADYFQNPVPFGWFKNLIDRVFGDDNNGGTISENVTISAPTIAPTPTPISYSTVVIPKTDIITGDTVYETNYYYVNPSGTPIITSIPPTNNPSSGGGGGGSTEYVPIGGDPFSIPAVNWLTSATIGDTNYDGIDSINEGMGSIDSIGSEYTDGMNVVQESTGTLPTSWLLLIGIAAAIPLLAGIVSRFLGG